MGRRPIEPAEDNVFGKRLLEIRKRRGLTQTELASKLGMQQSMIAQYERGYIRVHAATLIVRVARALETTPNELLGVEEIKAEGIVRNRRLLRRLRQIDQLPLADQKALIRFLDALLARQHTARRRTPPPQSATSKVSSGSQRSRRAPKAARRSHTG
jgi:transcriptional regulator with XRE-family HTH domain